MITPEQHYECARNLLTARNALRRVMAVCKMGSPAMASLESVWHRLRRQFDADHPGAAVSPYAAKWEKWS